MFAFCFLQIFTLQLWLPKYLRLPCVFCAWNITRGAYKEIVETTSPPPPSPSHHRFWLLLLFTGQRLLYLFLFRRRLFQLACLYLYVIKLIKFRIQIIQLFLLRLTGNSPSNLSYMATLITDSRFWESFTYIESNNSVFYYDSTLISLHYI